MHVHQFSHAFNFVHIVSASRAQFDLSSVANAMFMSCRIRWEDGWEVAMGKIFVFTAFALSQQWTSQDGGCQSNFSCIANGVSLTDIQPCYSLCS